MTITMSYPMVSPDSEFAGEKTAVTYCQKTFGRSGAYESSCGEAGLDAADAGPATGHPVLLEHTRSRLAPGQPCSREGGREGGREGEGGQGGVG